MLTSTLTPTGSAPKERSLLHFGWGDIIRCHGYQISSHLMPKLSMGNTAVFERGNCHNSRADNSSYGEKNPHNFGMASEHLLNSSKMLWVFAKTVKQNNKNGDSSFAKTNPNDSSCSFPFCKIPPAIAYWYCENAVAGQCLGYNHLGISLHFGSWLYHF